MTLATASFIVGLVTAFLPLQPGTVNMNQVVRFLKQDDRSHWRYLTFGFGDQLAFLSTLTSATTIDGSYHTARTLPELRSSGIGQIDTAFWLPNGLSALDPILQKASEHGVRWGFVNVPQYIPVLERNGWRQLTTLKGGVRVWENPNAILPSRSQPSSTNSLASFSWGTFPILSLVTSLSLGSLRIWPVQAGKVLQGIHSFLLGLIPISLCFWYYRTLLEVHHDRIYFTYTNALFFLSDALVLLAVILWLSSKVKDGFHLSSFIFLPLLFIVLTSLSVLWSTDWRTSLYLSLHIWLVFLLILSLHDWPQAWVTVLLGFCAALSLQFITGFVEFLNQSTAFLTPLNLNWPGLLNPSVRGASIIQLPTGQLFMRAYGTLPHPNILGGFTFVFLLGPVAFFLRKEKPNNLALLLLIPGISLLAITFSRAAWLALIAFSFILVWKSKYFERKRLAILLVIIALSFALTLFPYHQLVQARTTNTTSHSEAFSFIGRAWLSTEAMQTIRERPLTGNGIGSFIIQLAQRAGEGYVIEPVHNIFLLAGAELGLPGLLLMIALTISFAYRLLKGRDPNSILAGATITGLGIISLFDHYFWTLAPGRLALGLMLGLFAGKRS
jgi:O-antigen ligase